MSSLSWCGGRAVPEVSPSSTRLWGCLGADRAENPLPPPATSSLSLVVSSSVEMEEKSSGPRQL